MVILVPVVDTNAICRSYESVMDTWKRACVRPCFMRVVVAMSECPFGEERKCMDACCFGGKDVVGKYFLCDGCQVHSF